MNVAYFISKRNIEERRNSKQFARPIIRISVVAITIGMVVMILALSIVGGFQREIRNKVIGFGGHIQITNYDSQNTYEATPISKKQDFYPYLDTVKGIKHIQVYATKAGIIKTKEDIYGVVVKGIGEDFDWSFFQDKMVDGTTFKVDSAVVENHIVLSKTIANKMQLQVGEKMFLYFIQEDGQLRPKDFLVQGIYQSGLEQYDDLFVLADIAHIQKRNSWKKEEVGGFEVLIDKYEDLDKLGKFVYNYIGLKLYSTTIVEQNPEIFNWLDLQDLNVVVIIVLMVLVAIINIVSTLLILILDRTNTIGILKALGMSNWEVRKIFLYNATYIILKGLFWGNLIGIALCLLQLKYGVLTLPEASYYVSKVPIKLDSIELILLNIGTLLVCVTMLILPSYIVTKISPIKAIRYN